MMVEPLEDLVAAFTAWRSKKKHRRAPTPDDLIQRARALASVHGQWAIARAVKLDSRHFLEDGRPVKKRTAAAKPPSYSRVQVTMPSVVAARPFAELEMPSGIKLRLYSQTAETMGWLSKVWGAGGGR
jgi:hypothetical protein